MLLEEKEPEPLGHARLGRAQQEGQVAAGTTAGMPRFLNQMHSAPATEPQVEDEPSPGPAEQAPQEPDAHLVNDEVAASVADTAARPLPEVSGEGVKTEVTAYGVTLRGRTDASFSSSFRTLNVRTQPATGCDCAASDCVHVTGTLESTFRVDTTVTLPSVSDFPDLSVCQRQRVRDGINNVLRPHEQQHVAAFRTYNGTARTPIDFTICRGDFDARVQALHDSIEAPRQAVAQAASDALDPFEFNVDLNCQD